MSRIDTDRLAIRRLKSDEMPIVIDRIRTALVRLSRAPTDVRDLRLEELDLAAVSDYVWILWRDKSPVALLQVYLTHQPGGGFERITWLSEQEPEWAMQACISLGLRKTARHTIESLTIPRFLHEAG